MIFVGLYGENFIPEEEDEFDKISGFKPEWKYNMDYYPDKKYIRSGRRATFDGMSADYPAEALSHTYSRHMTMMFNVFFMLVGGNLFNARKVRDELNIFSGI